MKLLSGPILLAVALLSGSAVAAPAERGDARKAKAYLREIKKHLLSSFIDADRVKEEDLLVAGITAMSRGLEAPEFAAIAPELRAAVRRAIVAQSNLDDAVDAASDAAPELDLIAVADHGARAMVSVINDPYSHLFTDAEMERLAKMMQGSGREESAGLMLKNEGGRTRVAYVVYGYPAYEEGIEIGDEVVGIGGRAASDVRPEDYPEALRLPAGGTLELVLRRDGRDYPFRIASRKVSVKDVRFEYLGQGVGYLRLTIFDLSLVREAQKALKEMSQDGMKGLILDLRHNPGGAINAATGIADLFLGQGLVITRTVSRYKPAVGGFEIPGMGIEPVYKTSVRSDFESLPMVCLINGASASASELLAGALQDNRRAVLIGSTTYGKGVGQTPILLSSMLAKRYLYLTVLRYTTPQGHAVDHKGVAPQIPCDDEKLSPAKFAAAWTLRRSGRLERYLDAHWDGTMRRLADVDGFESSRYEGFDALYASLDPALTKDEIRSEIRRAARRRMEDEGRVWMTDLQSDRVLQRGLVEILDRLK